MRRRRSTRLGAHFGFCMARRRADAAQARQPRSRPSACARPAAGRDEHRFARPGFLRRASAWRWACAQEARTPRVYALLGDGELQEGEVWEGAMCAAHHGLANLCAIIDYNKLQSDDRNAAIMGLEPLGAEMARLRLAHASRSTATTSPPSSPRSTPRAPIAGKPTVIIAHTIKGKGVPLHGRPAALARQREADARAGRERAHRARRSDERQSRD